MTRRLFAAAALAGGLLVAGAPAAGAAVPLPAPPVSASGNWLCIAIPVTGLGICL